MSDIFLGLKCVQEHIGYDNLANQIEGNLKTYYDWALLSIGGWTDVSIPTSGVYGGDFSTLRPVHNPNYDDGQVWESAKKDWVWETGINYSDPTGGIHNPTPVGIPKVNGSTYSGTYHIDYPNGQVIFDNTIAGTVQLAYSYRTVQIYRADDAPFWRELQYNSFRVDSNQFQSSSGSWSILGQNRIQMPAVVIESVPRGRSKGEQLGSEVLETFRDVQFSVIAESKTQRNNFMDIFNLQSERKIWLFNINTIDYPLDYRGMLTGTKMYPDFVTNNRWRTMKMADSIISEIQQVHPQLFLAIVRTTMETIV